MTHTDNCTSFISIMLSRSTDTETWKNLAGIRMNVRDRCLEGDIFFMWYLREIFLNLGGGCKKYIACHGTLDPPMETIQYHSQREEGGWSEFSFIKYFPLFLPTKIKFWIFCNICLVSSVVDILLLWPVKLRGVRGLCKYRQTFEPIRWQSLSKLWCRTI